MLGWTAAANLGLHVGDRFNANGTWNTVTGIYSTGNAFGDAGAMFPLPAIQGTTGRGDRDLGVCEESLGGVDCQRSRPHRLRPT